jgi:predicted DNA-binding protein (UPF0251 family)
VPRPQKRRRIKINPEATYFKPRAIPLSQLEEVALGLDQLEAIRLCDLEGLDQTAAALKMKVSQSTLQRMLRAGRRLIAEALSAGKAIRITNNQD